MIYLGYFNVVEDLKKGSSGNRHGAVSLATDAKDVRQADRSFRRKLEELREQTDFFDDICEIYLLTIVELPSLPRRTSVVAHCEMYDHSDNTGPVYTSLLGRSPRRAKTWETPDTDYFEPFEEFDTPKNPEEHAQLRRDVIRRTRLEETKAAENRAAAQLGGALSEISELEFYLAHAFCLDDLDVGRLSIDALMKNVGKRKRLTLGQLIRAAESHWVIRPDIRRLLSRILAARNELMHGLLKRPHYRLTTRRGRQNLARFLSRLSRGLSFVKLPIIGAYCESQLLMERIANADSNTHRTMSPRERHAIMAFHKVFARTA